MNEIRLVLKNPKLELSDIYGTGIDNLLGPAIAEYFDPGIFIDMELLTESTDDFNEKLDRFMRLSKGEFGFDPS